MQLWLTIGSKQKISIQLVIHAEFWRGPRGSQSYWFKSSYTQSAEIAKIQDRDSYQSHPKHDIGYLFCATCFSAW